MLSLLICLNGMQIGAFAAENDESTAAPQSSSSQAVPAQSGTQEDDTAVTGEDTVTTEPEFTGAGNADPFGTCRRGEHGTGEGRSPAGTGCR